MRPLSALLALALGCSPPPAVTPCPRCPECPRVAAAPAPAPSPSPAPSPPPPPTPESLPLEPKESALVLATLFPKRLKTLDECRKRKTDAKTWTEVDTWASENLETGQFVPVIERRERGSFVERSEETRYRIRIDNCAQSLDGRLRIEVVFSTWSLTEGYDLHQRRPRPITQSERYERD